MKSKYIIFGGLVFLAGLALAAPPQINLSGVMESPQGENTAYIEGRLYQIDEEVSGYVIKKINSSGILVQVQGEDTLYHVAIGELGRVTRFDSDNGVVDKKQPSVKATTRVVGSDSSLPESKPSEKGSFMGGVQDVAVAILMGVGYIMAFGGGVWFLVVSFKESVWWGLGCLFISLVQLIFLIMYWHDVKKPFGLQLLGVGLVVTAWLASGSESELFFFR